MRTPHIDLFMAKVQKVESGCWLWTGSILTSAKPGAEYRLSGGYGLFHPSGERTVRAHRWSYEHFVGPIPDGMTLDHTCHTEDPSCAGGDACLHRRCVNPEHLKPMTRKANALAGGGPTAVNAVKTHCIHGHEFNEANTYWYNDHSMRGCRECRRLAGVRQLDKRNPDRKRRNRTPPKR